MGPAPRSLTIALDEPTPGPYPVSMRERTIRNGFFIVLVVLTTLAFFGLIRAFLMPLFWAVVLAVVFQPVHRWWLGRTRDRSSLASVLTILTILIVVLLPLALLGVALTREAVLLYDRIATGEIDLGALVRRARELVPMVTDGLERLGIELDRVQQGLSAAAFGGSAWIAAQALAIGQNALRITALSALMLYVLFFFLRDGDRILAGVVRALPLDDEREWMLLNKFASVSRATIGGALVVAGVQGAMGGLAFWALGISAPVFWGVVMTILSFLPAVGASLVWGPAAVVLAFTGSPVRAAILVVIGAALIGIMDNILRPLLVGRVTQLPDFLILVSTLGGLAVFGLSGVVIGPVIAAFFLAVWEMFAQEHAEAPAAVVLGPDGRAATLEPASTAPQPTPRNAPEPALPQPDGDGDE
jgi:predicted PurR-regulated permease PerM